MISEDIKRIYRADTSHAWAKDSLINFVSRRPGLYDKYELATIYLSYGQYTDMQNVLSYIDNNFELEEELQTDYTNFVSLMTITQNMQENNLYEEGLSEAQRTSLETILTNDRPIIAPIALSLLKRDNTNYEYIEAVYDVPQNSARKAKPEFNENSIEQSSEFKLYPNPANDYTTLSYNCKYNNLTYSVIDISGKKIKTDILKTIENMETNEVLINLGGISPGTYYFVIKTNDINLYTEKLIIAK